MRVEDQIQAIQNFLNDDSTVSAHHLMAQKLQTLRKLRESIKEVESAMMSSRN
jgi:hypothetical protein